MKFILRRLAFYLVAAWVALTLNFFIPRAVPGNAVEDMMSKFPNLQPAAYRALEALLGVGHPGSLWSQYWSYLDDVFHLNFGTDLINYPAQVSTLIAETIPWTLTLVGTATVIGFFVGTGLGIVAGWRHGGWLDRALPGLMFLQAIPYFFLALILIELLAVRVHVFPIAQGYAQGVVPGWDWAFISSAVYHSLLPAATIVITSVAGWMLQMRNVMITTIGEDYVVAAQAKGLHSRRVVFSYAARNALLPQLQGQPDADEKLRQHVLAGIRGPEQVGRVRRVRREARRGVRVAGAVRADQRPDDAGQHEDAEQHGAALGLDRQAAPLAGARGGQRGHGGRFGDDRRGGGHRAAPRADRR